MRRIVFVVLIVQVSLIMSRLFAGDTAQSEDELTRLKREYADVLGLTGTAKGEILAIAKICVRIPRSRSIKRQRVANTVSIAASIPWFTSRLRRKAHRKT